MIELGQQVRVLNSKDVPTGVIKLKVGKGVCPSRAQQYSSNAAMANSNASGSPDAATCLSGKRVRIRQSLRVDVAVPGDGHTPLPTLITPVPLSSPILGCAFDGLNANLFHGSAFQI